MAQSDTGNAVLDEISGPYRKVYGTVTKYLGDPSKLRRGKSVMDSIPKDNPNRKAWEEATKFTAKAKPLTNKTIGGKKRATKGKASQKKASKRE